MGDATTSLLLASADAAQWNRDLLQKFQAVLEEDPAADLLSLFPDYYRHEHRSAQYRQLSHAAKINVQTLDKLYDAVRDEPKVNLLSIFPKTYARKITMATGPRATPTAETDTATENVGPEFKTRLCLAETARVVFPLSEKAITLLAQYSENLVNSKLSDNETALLASVKQLIWESPKLWELPVRGVVVKCNEDIVVKVIWGNKDYTEYTSMQYLEMEAPDIPAPRPHGLIALGPFRVIFMSNIPGTTLSQAWPSMSHKQKLHIKTQLDDIFRRMRSIYRDEPSALGGTCGEGVKESRVDECALFPGITTTRDFDMLQFSAQHHGSASYVKLLRAFLERDKSTLTPRLVFTHGDIRPANIIVRQDTDSQDTDSDGKYVVSGIIDWEDSGFYPAYYECTAVTRTMSLVDHNDWYLYLPDSISPLEYPVRWLVDRLWLIHLKTI